MKDGSESIFWGLVLVVVGGFFLARNLGYIDFHFAVKTYWPVILILIGISVLLKSFGKSGQK
jgi:hypothetical protein